MSEPRQPPAAEESVAGGRVGYVGFGDNSFLDADARIEFSPIPMVGVFGGYRYLEVDESDIFIDASFSGLFGRVFVRF